MNHQCTGWKGPSKEAGLCESKEFYAPFEVSAKERIMTKINIGGINDSITNIYYHQTLILGVL